MRAVAVVGGVLLAVAVTAALVVLVIATDARCTAVRSVLVCHQP